MLVIGFQSGTRDYLSIIYIYLLTFIKFELLNLYLHNKRLQSRTIILN